MWRERQRQWACLMNEMNYERVKDGNWQSNICRCDEAILGIESLNVFILLSPSNLHSNDFLCCLKLHYNLICPWGYSNILCFVSVIMFSHIAKLWPVPKAFDVCRAYNEDDKAWWEVEEDPQIYVHCDISIWTFIILVLSEIMGFSQIFELMFFRFIENYELISPSFHFVLRQLF